VTETVWSVRTHGFEFEAVAAGVIPLQADLGTISNQHSPAFSVTIRVQGSTWPTTRMAMKVGLSWSWPTSPYGCWPS